MTKELSRKAELKECLEIIAGDLEAFCRTGMALQRIKDKELWKEDGANSFHEFCTARWGWGERHTQRLIAGAKIRVAIPAPKHSKTRSPTTKVGGAWNEALVRPLTRLRDKETGEPDLVAAKRVARFVLQRTEKKDGEKLTAALVQEEVDRDMGTVRAPSASSPKKANKMIDVVEDWTTRLDWMTTQLRKVTVPEMATFKQDHPAESKMLVEAIERFTKSSTRVWERL